MMPSVDALRAALSAEHAEHRRQAVIALADHPDASAGELLLKALGDADWRVREEAVRVGIPLAERWGLIDALVEAVCQGDNVGLRNAALELLGHVGEAAVERLVGALGSVEETARKFVIEALAHSGLPSVVKTLVAELGRAGPNEIASAIDALGAVGGPEAERALMAQLDSQDAYVRMAAMDALNRLRTIVPWESLEPLLTDRLVYRVALEALGRCADGRAVAPLVEALGDRASRVAATAALALARLTGDGARRDQVCEVLADLDDARRARLASLTAASDSPEGKAAVELLCLARDPAALRPMLELAEQRVLGRAIVFAMRGWGWDAVRLLLDIHRDERARFGALALEVASDLAHSIATRDETLVARLREQIRRELMGVEPDLLASAVRCMGAWGEPSDARRLVALASSEHADVRAGSQAALETIAERDPASVADALVGVNPDGPGGAQLAGLIARVAAADAPSRLHAALLAADPATRCAAIRGLAEHGGPKTAELLALSLTDESPDVQVAAADALGVVLGRRASAEGASALTAALDAPSDAVQAAAARALGVARLEDAAPELARLLREGQAAARVAAIDALRLLAPEDLPTLLEHARHDAEPGVVKGALRGLLKLQGPQSAGALRAALNHAAWDVRALAATLLGELGDERSIAALRARLEQERDAFVTDTLRAALAGKAER